MNDILAYERFNELCSYFARFSAVHRLSHSVPMSSLCKVIIKSPYQFQVSRLLFLLLAAVQYLVQQCLVVELRQGVVGEMAGW